MLKKTWYLIPLSFVSVTCLGQESKKSGTEETNQIYDQWLEAWIKADITLTASHK